MRQRRELRHHCAGCVIGGNCVAAGAQQAGSSCMVCDPARSTTGYVAAPAGTACGDNRAGACDDSDACDDSGTCQSRVRTDGSACSDAQACTIGDSCRAGLCAPGPLRSCPSGAVCDPASGDCVCQEGQQRCNGNQLELCSGGSFDLAEDCGSGGVCSAAAGRCDCMDDSDSSTTLVRHQSLGCGFSRNLGADRWVSFANGVQFDPGTGFAWLTLGFLTAPDAASACADLNIGGINGWRLPSIDEVRSLIAGCPATDACPLSDPACLSMSCGQCDSCFGSAGPKDGEYCRPIVPVCTTMHTRSTCRDCANPSFDWVYGPVNGNFIASDPTDRISGYCFHSGLSL